MPRVKKTADAEDLGDAEDPSLTALLVHIGNRIRELREMQNMPMVALEEFTGIALRDLRRIERGERNITMRTADKIARAIGVHTYELLVPREQSSIRRKRAKGAK